MKRILLLSYILVLLASCAREPYDETTFQPPVINPSVEEVMGELIGIITTTGNMPVEDAMVKIKGYSTVTDENGKFAFQNVTLFRDGSYIEVTKPGFLFGSRKIYALESETNVAQIELIPEPIGIAVTGQGVLDIDNIVKVDLPTGDYLLGANETYNGEKLVHLSRIIKNYNQLPGDLTGVDLNYKVKALSSLGVFNISISSQSNEQLQFPKDSKAQFELKLPDADVNDLQSVISLFYFDEFNGTWIEKGTATLVNDAYEGEIDAVGYWMLANSFPYSDVEGSLETPDQTYNDTYVEIISQSESYVSAFRTTTSGRYAGRVPQEVDLDLAVFHECAAGNQLEELGVLNQDEEVIDLVIVATEMDNIIIQGKITDCDGAVSDRSFVKVSFEEQQYLYRSDDQGNFDYSFYNCDDTEVSITAINVNEETVSEVINLDIANNINAGEIQTCGSIVAGYDISYDFMDWDQELEDNVEHTWSINRISGTNPRTIFSIKMINKDTDELYLQGAFVIRDNEPMVDYQLSFKTQGFIVLGECELEINLHSGLNSFRFFGTGDDIDIVDEDLYPTENIDLIDFSVVYYD